MNNVFIEAMFDYRLSWLTRVDINTAAVQVVVDKTLAFLSQRKSDGGFYVLYNKTKPATGC